MFPLCYTCHFVPNETLAVPEDAGGPGMIKRGSKIRVVKMDTAGGMDWQAKRLV